MLGMSAGKLKSDRSDRQGSSAATVRQTRPGSEAKPSSTRPAILAIPSEIVGKVRLRSCPVPPVVSRPNSIMLTSTRFRVGPMNSRQTTKHRKASV